MIHCLVGELLFRGVKFFKPIVMASLCPCEFMKGLYFTLAGA